MVGVSLKLELQDFAPQLALLKRPGAPIARALNRSINSGRTEAKRRIAEDMGLKVSDAADFVTVQEATPDRLTATVKVSARRVPLIKFGATGPEPSRGQSGVRANLKGGTGTYPDAFIARMASGHRGVFKRIGSARKSRGAWTPNLPILELKGPSAWASFQKHQPAVIARVQEQLAKNLPHEIQYALSR